MFHHTMKGLAGTCGLAAIASGLASIILLSVLPLTAFGQGESAVPFLLISPNSRASGMGESGVALADDAASIFWNPAGLAFQMDQGTEISITHANWLPQFGQSDLFYEYLNFRYPVPYWGGTFGASVTYLNLGEFIQTGSTGPEEIGRFKSFEFAITAGYGTRVLNSLGLGVNLRFIHSSLSPIGAGQEEGTGRASTISFDIATLWRPTHFRIPLLGLQLDDRFGFGVNLSNLGPKVTYIDANQADPLPTNFRLGLAFDVLQSDFNNITYTLDFSRLLIRRHRADTTAGAVGEAKPPDPFYKAIFTAWGDGGLRKANVSTGLEYWYGRPRLIALRMGYFWEDPQFGNRKFLSFGAGIRYSMYGFDFSYISTFEENHPLSDTLRFTLLIGWGGA